MTEPDFWGGADRNPQLSGVDLDSRGRFDFRGGAEKVVVHVHPPAPPKFAPLYSLYSSEIYAVME